MENNRNKKACLVINREYDEQEFELPGQQCCMKKLDPIIGKEKCDICYTIMVEPTKLDPHCSHRFCI